jgi:hypothetical protein
MGFALGTGLATNLGGFVRFAADRRKMAPAAVAVRITWTDVKRSTLNIFNKKV